MNPPDDVSSRPLVASMATRADLPQPSLEEPPLEWTSPRIAAAVVVGTPTLVAAVAWVFYSLVWLDDAAWSAQRSCTTSSLAPLSVGLPIGAFVAVALGCAVLDRALGQPSWPQRAQWIRIALTATVVLATGTSRWWASEGNAIEMASLSVGYGLGASLPLYFLTAVSTFLKSWRPVPIAVGCLFGLGLAAGLIWLGLEHWHVCPPTD